MSARDKRTNREKAREKAMLKTGRFPALPEEPVIRPEEIEVVHMSNEDLKDIPEDEPWDFDVGVNKEFFDHLETMFNRIHKQKNNKQLVDDLRMFVGSAHNVLTMDRFVLQQLGMNHLDAMLMDLTMDVCRITDRTSYGDRPKIGRLDVASPYIASNFLGLKEESFYLFCINAHGNMKSRFLLNRGIEDRALLSIQTLMVEVLRADPHAVLVAHNHPGGTLRPSQADIEATHAIINALTVLHVPLVDHLIVANGKVVSMRENGLLPECVWANQPANNHLLRNWLKPTPPKKPPKPKELTREQIIAKREKERKRMRNQLHQNMQLARGEYRRSMKQAEGALQRYRGYIAQELEDQQWEMRRIQRQHQREQMALRRLRSRKKEK